MSASPSSDIEKYAVIGWREWLALPDLGLNQIKAKIDTGARTSALHAKDIQKYTRNGKQYVKFKVYPVQRNTERYVAAAAEVVEWRRIKDSGGKETERPVIHTPVRVGDREWDIELTLVGRDEMGFRMLLGRQAVRDHLLVNPGGSYLLGTKKKKKKTGKKQS